MNPHALRKAGRRRPQSTIGIRWARDKRRYRVVVPVTINVRSIRAQLGLSQQAFAARYGLALSAVRDWEQGRRRPDRSTRILLQIVAKEPEAVSRALRSRRRYPVWPSLIITKDTRPI